MAESSGQDRPLCIDISLQPVGSSIRASDAKDVPFTRAVLTVRNVCGSEVDGVICHATLGQEGGTVQDVSAVFPPAASLAAGEKVTWDVYDLLLPAHPGTASKVHMFGYRAALNWRFDLAAWAEYRSPGSSSNELTPVSRWSLHWGVPDPSTGAVVLTIEAVTG
jgi:hypothetical protein